MASSENNPARVLVLAPTAKDAATTQALLEQVGLGCVLCKDVRDLAQHVRAGAEAALLTEEAFISEQADELRRALSEQPAWSDLPLVLLVSQFLPADASAIFSSVSNVTLLDRPAPMRTLVSAVQAAVRNRERQYQLRRALAENQKSLERERAARSEAERANRVKDEFLATVSHELRTPLTAILGWTQLLQRKPSRSAEEMHKGLAAIARNARSQAELIEDLLDTGRIMSGKLRLEIQTVEAVTVVQAALDTVRPAAEAKGVDLVAHLDPGTGPIECDPNRLQQVVCNLLTNAVKFTSPGGSIRVSLTRGEAHIEITVADTGKGIPAEFLPHVFDRFAQADGSITRLHGGLGLGLAIVKSLVEMHDGRVQARSPGEGKGTTFSVTLPRVGVRPRVEGEAPEHAGDPRPALPPCDVSLAGLTILVVDDESDARDVLSQVLGDCRAAVCTAASAREALGIMHRERIDLVLSDIAMPGEDGYWLIREIRSLPPEKGGTVPAAALTALARSEDIGRALRAGYQRHIPKPVDHSDLLAVVAGLCGRSPPPPSG